MYSTLDAASVMSCLGQEVVAGIPQPEVVLHQEPETAFLVVVCFLLTTYEAKCFYYFIWHSCHSAIWRPPATLWEGSRDRDSNPGRSAI